MLLIIKNYVLKNLSLIYRCIQLEEE